MVTATHLNSDAAVSAESAVEDAAPAAPAAPSIPTGFCRGYVGGEGPEPMIMPGFGTSKNFDPFGFADRAPEWVPWFREAELKHGRAAMLATVGFVVPELFRIPGAQFSKAAIPNVVDAHDALPDSMIQIIGWISLLEACSFAAYANMDGYDRRPGDFGFDPLSLYPKDEKGQRERQLQELKNGRLAMIAIGGMVTQATITGHGFPYV
ncbi:hypothetical protein TrRE_jg9274 [Triparma retinervis]|uniref:Chlorophyll a-b binding protein, chloroplastic n=1 Tax=Triparma retinervis TaxID=2557542 RepID=A0A9W7AP55_9STRA|nr:hypothetical protein TrRE_jg9274 [Triparma retinervis]